MKILMDGDSCKRKRRVDYLAYREKIESHIFFDVMHNVKLLHSQHHQVEHGKDSVDFTLLRYVEKGDIVVTNDSGLASMALAKKAYVINNHGIEYTDANIMSYLNRRYIHQREFRKRKQVRGMGTKNQMQFQDFDKEFSALIQRAKQVAC